MFSGAPRSSERAALLPLAAGALRGPGVHGALLRGAPGQGALDAPAPGWGTVFFANFERTFIFLYYQIFEFCFSSTFLFIRILWARSPGLSNIRVGAPFVFTNFDFSISNFWVSSTFQFIRILRAKSPRLFKHPGTGAPFFFMSTLKKKTSIFPYLIKFLSFFHFPIYSDPRGREPWSLTHPGKLLFFSHFCAE